MPRAMRMSGKQLQDSIVEEAHALGYIAAHFTAAPVRPGVFVTTHLYDGKGFPDLVLVSERRRRILFIEVKGDGDRVRTVEQGAWIAALEAAGGEIYVVKPKDLRDGTVTRILKGDRAPA